jgi:hypothetical protein
MMTASDFEKSIKISKRSLLIPSVVICLAAAVVGGGFAYSANMVHEWPSMAWDEFWANTSYWQEDVCETAWWGVFSSEGGFYVRIVWIGRVSGLLAGVVWCFIMTGLTRRLLRRSRGMLFRTMAMLGGGALAGVAVVAAGFILGVIVHLGVMLRHDFWSVWVDAIGLGLYFGALAGLALGLVGGAVWSVFVAVVGRRSRV